MSQNEVVEIYNENAQGEIVFICEHASNHIPDDLNDLGLESHHLKDHIAWDIGAAAVTKNLADHFKSSAVLAGFSRLLIDPNREEDHAGLVPEVSDKIFIPGNQNLGADGVEARKQRFYHPFHLACRQHLDRCQKMKMVVAIHSFTPSMDGFDRPWPIGLLWNKDQSLAKSLLAHFEVKDINIGDNLPYSGKDLFHTMNLHGGERGLPHVGIELRQDQTNHGAGIQQWSQHLIEAFEEILENHS